MYNSIKSWMNIPLVIHPFVKRTGTGTKVFAEGINTKCYAAGEVVVVKNDDGEEVTSKSQLYIDGKETIKSTDKVTFDGHEHEIKSINTFYRNGLADVKVVYL